MFLSAGLLPCHQDFLEGDQPALQFGRPGWSYVPFGDHLGVSMGYPGTQKSNGLPSCFPVELPFSDIHHFQTNPFGLLIGPCEVSCLLMDKSELEKPETKACMARKGLMHGNRATGHLRLSERFEECYCTLLSCTTYNCANPKLYLPSPVATDEHFP